MVGDGQTKSSCEEETSLPVTPQQTGNHRGEDPAKYYEQGKVPIVLPLDQPILPEVRYIGPTGMKLRFEDHPANVCP
jgi:hypothetical protein